MINSKQQFAMNSGWFLADISIIIKLFLMFIDKIKSVKCIWKQLVLNNDFIDRLLN